MILLDTHSLLWLVTDDDRLGPESRERIATAGRVCFSSISISEIVIKHMLGRIGLPGDAGFPAVFATMGLVELPFTAAHADALRAEPSLVRHDPFDRFLLAQAAADRLDLLSADRTLLGLGRPWVFDARR